MLLTTTGTLDPVVINNLRWTDNNPLSLPHPTTNFNLAEFYDDEDLQVAQADIQALLAAGHITLTSVDGNPITDFSIVDLDNTELATIAYTGDYNDMAANAPTLGPGSGWNDADDIPEGATNKFVTQAQKDQIGTNQTDIATLQTEQTTQNTNISTNTGDISTIQTEQTTQNTNIGNNTTAIGTNTTDIANNATNIGTNTTNIATNTGNITTNTGNISTNTTNIATNASDISTLQTEQTTQNTNISANTTGVAANGAAITTLQANAAMVYEVYETGATTITTAATTIPMTTERFASADFSISGGGVQVTNAGRYKLEYTVSADSPNNVRNTAQHDFYVNGAIVAGSKSWSYHRTTAAGEQSASRRIILDLAANDIVTVQSSTITNTATTLTQASGIVIERVQ